MNPFLDVALRSLAVYFFMFAAIRVFGKNQLSQLNAGDIVLLLLISNQPAIFSHLSSTGASAPEP